MLWYHLALSPYLLVMCHTWSFLADIPILSSMGDDLLDEPNSIKDTEISGFRKSHIKSGTMD